MNTHKATRYELQTIEVPVPVKLAALWAGFMFLYIYIDYFHLYMPGTLQSMIAGKVFVFDVTPTFLLVVLAAVVVPSSMIFLSVTLPAKANRYTNMVVAALHIPYCLFNLAGEAWRHMVLGAAVEVIFLCLIIRYAWKWPRVGG
jgi:hypothetical protein